MNTRTPMVSHRLLLALACAGALVAPTPAPAQQQPGVNVNPAAPTPSALPSSRTQRHLGAALLVTGVVAAWWAEQRRAGGGSEGASEIGDPRVEKVRREVEEKLRERKTDSNGDVTTTQKDGKGRVVERRKADKDGQDKDFDAFRYDGEVCVYEHHFEHLRGGGYKSRTIHRDKDGNVISDESLDFDKGGSHVGGTRTIKGSDGTSKTEIYDRETNEWK